MYRPTATIIMSDYLKSAQLMDKKSIKPVLLYTSLSVYRTFYMMPDKTWHTINACHTIT